MTDVSREVGAWGWAYSYTHSTHTVGRLDTRASHTARTGRRPTRDEGPAAEHAPLDAERLHRHRPAATSKKRHQPTYSVHEPHEGCRGQARGQAYSVTQLLCTCAVPAATTRPFPPAL